MKKKMSIMGVGAKIAIPVLLWLVVSEVVTWLTRPLFSITTNKEALLTAGITLITVGFSLNLVAAFTMLKANKKNRLATDGLYAIFRDPMYVLQIFITMPGLFLLFNSWLVLTGILPAYIFFRIFVREEHKYLEELYGEEYRKYLNKVPVKI